jgi:hypothetical protein
MGFRGRTPSVKYQQAVKRRGAGMTQTRLAIVAFLERYWGEHGHGPTISEIGQSLQLHNYAIRVQMNKLLALGKVQVDRLPSGAVMARSWRVRYG